MFNGMNGNKKVKGRAIIGEIGEAGQATASFRDLVDAVNLGRYVPSVL